MTFSDKSNYVSHMKRYPSGKMERFKCTFLNCYSILSSSKAFKQHLGIHEAKGSLTDPVFNSDLFKFPDAQTNRNIFLFPLLLI